MAFKMKGFPKKGDPVKEAVADPDFWKTAEDGSMVNKHYYVNKNSPEKDKIDAGWIKAEDGTYVPPSYYKK